MGPQKILQLFHLLLDRSPAFEIKWKIWQNFITVGHVNWKYKPIIFGAEILCILWRYHKTWCSSGAFHQLAQRHRVTFWTACSTVLQSKPVDCRTVSHQRDTIYNWVVQELLSAYSLFPRSSKNFELFLWASYPNIILYTRLTEDFQSLKRWDLWCLLLHLAAIILRCSTKR